MSKKYPECPLYNHSSCKDIDNPELCAIVRKDKVCLKKTQSQNQKVKKRNHPSDRDLFFDPPAMGRDYFVNNVFINLCEYSLMRPR